MRAYIFFLLLYVFRAQCYGPVDRNCVRRADNVEAYCPKTDVTGNMANVSIQ